jgi:hypothetical protein
MEIFRDNTGGVYNWVVKSLNNNEDYPNDLTIGIVYDNIIIAGVIYSVVGDETYISIYATSPKWITKKTASTILELPFKAFNSKKVICATSASNKRINKLLRGLNLKEEKTKNYRKDGSNLYLFSITQDELNKERWYVL